MSMNSSTVPHSSPSVTELVSGIVGDVQDLGMQHLDLFKLEIKEDLRKTTDAASSLAIGLAVAQVGAVLLSFMLVHLLASLAPSLSLWVCFGIVGAVFAALGAIGIINGVNKLKTVDSLSRQAAQVMKEDAQWLTNSK
jgi:uncharacterized membrane protein YqjE